MARQRFLLQLCFVVLGCVSGLALFVWPDVAQVRGLVAVVFGVYVLFWMARFLGADGGGGSRGHLLAQLTEGPAWSVPDLARDYYADVRFVAVVLGLAVYAGLDLLAMILAFDAGAGLAVAADMRRFFDVVQVESVLRVDPLGHGVLWQIVFYGVLGAGFVLSYWAGRICADVRRFFAPVFVVFIALAVWYGALAEWAIADDLLQGVGAFGVGSVHAEFLAGQVFSDLYGAVGFVIWLQAVGLIGALMAVAAGLFVAVRLVPKCKGLFLYGALVVLIMVGVFEVFTAYSGALRGLYVVGFMVWGLVLGAVYKPRRKAYRVYK